MKSPDDFSDKRLMHVSVAQQIVNTIEIVNNSTIVLRRYIFSFGYYRSKEILAVRRRWNVFLFLFKLQ